MSFRVARYATILLIGLLLAGCPGQVSKNMASWQGHNFNELIASWGPPQEVFSDGQGGYIFVYTQTREFIQPGHAYTTVNATSIGNYVSAYGYTTYTPASVSGYTAYRMFWIDSTGSIYSWAWKGL